MRTLKPGEFIGWKPLLLPIIIWALVGIAQGAEPTTVCYPQEPTGVACWRVFPGGKVERDLNDPRDTAGDVIDWRSETVVKRDPAQVVAFRKTHACPSTGKLGMGACPGYVVNHICPLCWCGIDRPENMEWEEQQASYKRDVFERAACKLKNGH